MNKNAMLMSEYENMLRHNPRDTKIRWNLVLSRYEIVEVNGNLLLGRTDLQEIYEDRDARLLLQDLTQEEKPAFLQKIRWISETQNEALKVADIDPKAEVYLAFDQTSREDSEIAAEIYKGLQGEGISVYYEPEWKLTLSPDAHRLVAMQNAKVMLVIGTAAEHMACDEVAGAWARYMNMMDRDSSKHLLPAYRTMKPEEFPEAIYKEKIQGIDVGRIGSIQHTLLPRIKEFLNKGDQTIVVTNASGKKVNITNLLNRINFFVEDSNFDEAGSRLAEFAKEYGTDYPKYHYLKMLIKYQAGNDKELAVKAGDALLSDENYTYYMEHASEEDKKGLESVLASRDAIINAAEEDKLVKEIITAHENSDYDEILRINDRISKLPSFLRWGDIQGFVDTAKSRQENQKLLKEYKKVMKSPDTYYMDRLKELSPNKYYILTSSNVNEKVPTDHIKYIILGILSIVALIAAQIVEPMDARKVLAVALLVIIAVPVYLDIKDGDSVILAVVLNVLKVVAIPILIVTAFQFFKLTDPDGPLEFINKFFGRLCRLDENAHKDEYTYAFVLILPLLYSIVRAVVKFIKSREEISEITNAKKAYKDLFESGFLANFEKSEYDYLVRTYGDAVGEDWIEPKSYWK